MKYASNEVLHTIDRLQSGSPILLNILLDWFKTLHKAEHFSMEEDDEAGRRDVARGRAQCLTYIIDTIERADEVLKKMTG